jgi:integrase
MKSTRGIWKHPKTENWIARYRGSEGKWINRSTGTSDEKEAGRIAMAWKVEAERERDRQKGDVSPAGISDAVARAERLAREGRLDVHAARELINDLLTAAGHDAVDAVTNKDWCETWIKSKQGAVKSRSTMKYEQVTRDWLKFIKQKNERPLEAIAKADGIAFRDHLIKAGLSARTTNQTIKLLRGIYADAAEQGLLNRNPFAGVHNLRETSENLPRVPFSNAEVAALIEKAEGDWKGMVILSATTGLRLMDAARLKWINLDLKAKLIRVKTAKTGAKLDLPIHPRFANWLRAKKRRIGTAPVFPSLANKVGTGKSGLSMAFKRLMERAGVKAGVARQAEKKSRGRSTSQKSFHSLRHFAATQLAAAGVRAEIARQITGHTDINSHSEYVKADFDVLREAVEAIPLSA